MTDAVPSGFYLVSARLFSPEEMQEQKRLIREHGYDGNEAYCRAKEGRFYTEVWPRARASMLDTIEQHDPAALLYFVDNDRNRAAFIKPGSDALIGALAGLDHVDVEEIPPLTTLDDITNCYHKWAGDDPKQERQEPPWPGRPESKAAGFNL